MLGLFKKIKKCSCGSCGNGKGEQYYLGQIKKDENGEDIYLRMYSVCADCIRKVNPLAVINSNDHREVPVKYFDEIVCAFMQKATSEHMGVLMQSEAGRDELRKVNLL